MILHFLYKDETLVICVKPVGISSESPGLPDLIRQQEGYSVFPVHRLDQTTGGAILLARSPDACARLQQLFQQKCISKEYLAVVSGAPETDHGLFEDLLYHDCKTNKSFVVKKNRKGVRAASCEWNTLATAVTADGSVSLVRVLLHTGRTHQIRIQFASRNLPLVGDLRYGSRIRAAVPSLWSSGISFSHPYSDGKTVNAVSYPPDIFPWSLFQQLIKAPYDGAPETTHPFEKQL